MYRNVVRQHSGVDGLSLDSVPLSAALCELIIDAYTMCNQITAEAVVAAFPTVERTEYAIGWVRRVLHSECARQACEAVLKSPAYLSCGTMTTLWRFTKEQADRASARSSWAKVVREDLNRYDVEIVCGDNNGNPATTPYVSAPAIKLSERNVFRLDCYILAPLSAAGFNPADHCPFMVVGVPPTPEYHRHRIRDCSVSTIIADRFVRAARGAHPLFLDFQNRITDLRGDDNDD